MLKDAQGLPVTTNSPQAIAAINGFVEQSLRYGRHTETLVLKGITADPNCALLRAYAAAYYLSQENEVDRARAEQHLAQMQSGLDRVSRREQLYIRAIAAWASGNFDQAIADHEALALAFPQDLLSVQQGQYHFFYRGESARLLELAQSVVLAHRESPRLPLLQGMVAFGLEQCYQLDEAERLGRLATKNYRHNPWAHHAVAHVLDTQGRCNEGIAWMEGLADTWEYCNSMLYTHNWWHIALFYLAQGNAAAALRLYDQHIWGKARRESPKDQVGAIALLLRLELKGVSVGRRWHSMVRYLKARTQEHALPFQDLHFVYALARAGQQSLAEAMIEDMDHYAQTLDSIQCQRWCNLAIPAAEGLVAYARGCWSSAATYLKPVLPHLDQLGGSHTQRRLFQQIYQQAVLKSQMNSRFAASAALCSSSTGW
ncbi:tetratricopeptide repeat protein [Pseudanabaena sp. FACHB-2040]|nr:tetratricopeptide repeat protein [Pseudanabaena sp. FACHB-2040]